jgi:hypothetical protein
LGNVWSAAGEIDVLALLRSWPLKSDFGTGAAVFDGGRPLSSNRPTSPVSLTV